MLRFFANRIPSIFPAPRVTLNGARAMSGLPPVVEVYSMPMRIMHWLTGFGLIGCVATVQGAMSQPKTPEGNAMRGNLMNAHKSMGLLLAGLIPLRLAFRLSSKIPAPLPGAAWEHLISKAVHFALYAGMVVLPGTGVAMGYYGGRGLPFFGTTIPGASKPDGAIAKNAYNVHKQVGGYWKYTIPVHVGGAFFHVAKGQPIFSRIGFMKPA